MGFRSLRTLAFRLYGLPTAVAKQVITHKQYHSVGILPQDPGQWCKRHAHAPTVSRSNQHKCNLGLLNPNNLRHCSDPGMLAYKETNQDYKRQNRRPLKGYCTHLSCHHSTLRSSCCYSQDSLLPRHRTAQMQDFHMVVETGSSNVDSLDSVQSDRSGNLCHHKCFLNLTRNDSRNQSLPLPYRCMLQQGFDTSRNSGASHRQVPGHHTWTCSVHTWARRLQIVLCALQNEGSTKIGP